MPYFLWSSPWKLRRVRTSRHEPTPRSLQKASRHIWTPCTGPRWAEAGKQLSGKQCKGVTRKKRFKNDLMENTMTRYKKLLMIPTLDVPIVHLFDGCRRPTSRFRSWHRTMRISSGCIGFRLRFTLWIIRTLGILLSSRALVGHILNSPKNAVLSCFRQIPESQANLEHHGKGHYVVAFLGTIAQWLIQDTLDSLFGFTIGCCHGLTLCFLSWKHSQVSQQQLTPSFLRDNVHVWSWTWRAPMPFADRFRTRFRIRRGWLRRFIALHGPINWLSGCQCVWINLSFFSCIPKKATIYQNT